jgi:hypothetical protein
MILYVKMARGNLREMRQAEGNIFFLLVWARDMVGSQSPSSSPTANTMDGPFLLPWQQYSTACRCSRLAHQMAAVRGADAVVPAHASGTGMARDRRTGPPAMYSARTDDPRFCKPARL